ncbi:apolipoprotein N-acyltransferase [Altererythrobacter aquiaggeris]|uniref:apolipoprotein N-acyltransferase n=1 Tax=Aestuarierythrobacter aquiaggeris TaxID=1898396 RepID=UPI003017BA4E
MSSAANFADRARAYPNAGALVLGAVSATGFAPLSLWPLALLAVGLFAFVVARAATIKRAAMAGWLFGLGHFAVGNSWMANSFKYQDAMPAWLGWLAVLLAAIYLAVYPAIAAVCTRLVCKSGLTWQFAAIFAAFWTLSEWLRSWAFTGYPWNPFGAVLVGPFDRTGAAIVLPWTGTYALSGLAVFLGAAAVILFGRRRFPWLGGAAALLLAAMVWPASARDEGDLTFTLVQPDLRQQDVNNPATFETQFRNIATLSLPRDPGQKRLVFWPESGVPDYLRSGYPQRYYDQMTAAGDPEFARQRIGRVIGEGSIVLTGAVDLEIRRGRAAGARNVVTAMDETGAIIGGYDKAHLVPYGEYLALRWLLEPLGANRLVAGTIDFWPGPGPQTLDLGDMGKIGPQICYEIIFSGHVTDRRNRPDFIFNPSNDGWFGSWGPPQHLAQARMRAIEEGLPVLRATTTGISAVIDADGIVRDHIGLQKAGRIDGLIPPPREPTLFARLGNYLPLGWAFLVLLIAMVAPRFRRG